MSENHCVPQVFFNLLQLICAPVLFQSQHTPKAVQTYFSSSIATSKPKQTITSQRQEDPRARQGAEARSVGRAVGWCGLLQSGRGQVGGRILLQICGWRHRTTRQFRPRRQGERVPVRRRVGGIVAQLLRLLHVRLRGSREPDAEICQLLGKEARLVRVAGGIDLSGCFNKCYTTICCSV